MCGRFTLKTSRAVIAGLLGVRKMPELGARYNIAPSQPAARVHRVRERDEIHGRAVALRASETACPVLGCLGPRPAACLYSGTVGRN